MKNITNLDSSLRILQRKYTFLHGVRLTKFVILVVAFLVAAVAFIIVYKDNHALGVIFPVVIILGDMAYATYYVCNALSIINKPINGETYTFDFDDKCFSVTNESGAKRNLIYREIRLVQKTDKVYFITYGIKDTFTLSIDGFEDRGAAFEALLLNKHINYKQ